MERDYTNYVTYTAPEPDFVDSEVERLLLLAGKFLGLNNSGSPNGGNDYLMDTDILREIIIRLDQFFGVDDSSARRFNLSVNISDIRKPTVIIACC